MEKVDKSDLKSDARNWRRSSNLLMPTINKYIEVSLMILLYILYKIII